MADKTKDVSKTEQLSIVVIIVGILLSRENKIKVFRICSPKFR